MARYASFLVVALLSGLVVADLYSDLNDAGITALFPNDDGYAAASKAFNLRFTFQPAAVAYPYSTNDVSAIVKAGADNNLQVVARGGGHSYVANGLGGKNGSVVVDMSRRKDITIHSSTNTAIIETGNRLGDIALALNTEGRALPHGSCPTVGVGGHSAFGGYGFTSRMWGLTLDTIFGINAVLANGTIVRATKDSDPDLFWALRGAAPSFAITTSIEVNTFPAPSYAIVLQYNWSSIDYQTAAKSTHSFQDFALSGPASPFTGELVVTQGSQEGEVAFAFTGAWFGDQHSAVSTLQPWLDVMPTPTSADLVGNGTYIDSLFQIAGRSLNTSKPPDSSQMFYTKSLMTPESAPMSLEACTAFTKNLATEGFDSNTDWFVEIELYGGPNSKIKEVPNNATAFSRRDTLFTMQFHASSLNFSLPFPAEGIAFMNNTVNSITASMPSDWNYGAYMNYIDDELNDWENLYFSHNYPRLRLLKEQFDPSGVFTFPTSVEEYAHQE